MRTTIDISEVNKKIKILMENIVKLDKVDSDYELDELNAKIKQLSEIIVCLKRLKDIENDSPTKDGCVNINDLLTLCTLKTKMIYELRSAAIKINNIEYALFLSDGYGPIDSFLIQEAIDYNRLFCLYKMIHKQITHNIITDEHFENILELILKNKNASIVAEAIMVEFPTRISEQLLERYHTTMNSDLLGYIKKELSDSKRTSRYQEIRNYSKTQLFHSYSSITSEHELLKKDSIEISYTT